MGRPTPWVNKGPRRCGYALGALLSALRHLDQQPGRICRPRRSRPAAPMSVLRVSARSPGLSSRNAAHNY